MRSVRSRFSEASATSRICSGRLSRPDAARSRDLVKPNLVAITTLFADRLQRLADQLLIGVRAIDLGGVEEGDAALDGGADQLMPACFSAPGRSRAQPHAAQADGGDFQPAFSECALLHVILL